MKKHILIVDGNAAMNRLYASALEPKYSDISSAIPERFYPIDERVDARRKGRE